MKPDIERPRERLRKPSQHPRPRAGDREAMKEWLIAQVHEFVEQHGHPPRYVDANRAHARIKNAPFELGWPSTSTFSTYWGGLTVAVDAAGYIPLRPGRGLASVERDCVDCGRRTVTGDRSQGRCSRCYKHFHKYGTPWSAAAAADHSRARHDAQTAAARERAQRCVELRRDGLSNRQIAERLGMHEVSVGRLLSGLRKAGQEVPLAPHFKQ